VGEIDSGTSGDGFDGRVLGSDTLADDIEQAREDDAVKAVVIRIDSPGGSSVASDVLWRELELTRDAKPLVASMSDLAASGGYFIAIPAHVIVAQPGTLTGSIGVFAGKLVPGGTLEKLGINVESVSIGRFSDIESPVRPFSKAERAKMQEQLQDFYDTFLERVAEARGKTPDEIHEVAQGRVWTGRQAKEVGLVDELGGLDVALRIAKERAGLKADQDVDLVIYPLRKGFSDLLANPWPQFESRLRTAALSWILLPDEQRALNALTHPFRRFRRGEPLALMPYVFVR